MYGNVKLTGLSLPVKCNEQQMRECRERSVLILVSDCGEESPRVDAEEEEAANKNSFMKSSVIAAAG